MRVVALADSAEHICYRYRVAAYRGALADAGHTLEFRPLPQHTLGRLAVGLGLRADVVVVQRKLLPRWSVALLRRRVRRLVFDFDDAVWLRDSYSRRGFSDPKLLHRFRATVEASDLIVAGNEFLAAEARRYVPRDRVVVIPTCLDTGKYPLAEHAPRKALQLVWIGSSSTLRGLERFAPTLSEIGRACPGTRLKLICDRFIPVPDLPVDACRWRADTEAAEIASADAGIGWVPDDPWSRGKCGLKILQYHAAGLPVIANPVGVQSHLVRDGETGYLATTPAEWVSAVVRLGADVALRRALGLAGRQQAEERYSLAAGSRAWLAALDRLGGRGAAEDRVRTHMLAHLWRKLVTLTGPPALPTVRSAGRVWYLTPAGADLFGPDGPQLDRWMADGSAAAVKSNPTRTLYRIELPAATVYVKHCRVNSPRGWLREALRPPKARLEFENALALRAGGIPAVEPLAWGGPDSHWPGENFLITRAIPGVPFTHYLEHHLPALPPDKQPAARREAARALARLFALLHDAGVNHPDPHPGNLLVEVTPCGVPRLTLLDLHDVRTGTPLGWAESRENLVLLNRYFELRADRADRARFWHTYCRSRTTLPTAAPHEMRTRANELERATRASNLRFWAAREQRWLGSNRTIRRVRHGALRGLAVRDLSDDFLRTLLADPDAPFAAANGPQILKDCATSTVVVIPMPTPAGVVPVVFKRVNTKSWASPVKNLLHRSAVLRSWSSGHTLRDRCLPTPRPLAVFHRHRFGCPTVGYLLTEMVPGAVQLDDAVAAGAEEALLRLARVLRMMHDRGVSHRDLKAANILLADGTDPVLIDLVGVRTGVRLDVARRAKELARLNVSFLHSRHVTSSDRLRFLRAYLSAGPALGVGWKSWWDLVSRATAAKVERNRRSGRGELA